MSGQGEIASPPWVLVAYLPDDIDPQAAVGRMRFPDGTKVMAFSDDDAKQLLGFLDEPVRRRLHIPPRS